MTRRSGNERPHFSVLLNGQKQGRPFPSWEGAKESLWRMVDRLHYQAQRFAMANPSEGREIADHNGRAKSLLLARMTNGANERPRPELQATVYAVDGTLLNLRLRKDR